MCFNAAAKFRGNYAVLRILDRGRWNWSTGLIALDSLCGLKRSDKEEQVSPFKDLKTNKRGN